MGGGRKGLKKMKLHMNRIYKEELFLTCLLTTNRGTGETKRSRDLPRVARHNRNRFGSFLFHSSPSFPGA